MIFRHLLNMRSHPTWVRGLKLPDKVWKNGDGMSHPTWVRGLKLSRYRHCRCNTPSHPTWVRGLKLYYGAVDKAA